MSVVHSEPSSSYAAPLYCGECLERPSWTHCLSLEKIIRQLDGCLSWATAQAAKLAANIRTPARQNNQIQHHKTTKSNSGALPIPAPQKQPNPAQTLFLFQNHKTTKSSSGALRVPAPKTIKSSSRPPSCSITAKQSNPAQVPGYKVSILVCTG